MTQDNGASAEPTGLSSASQIEPGTVSTVPASIPSAMGLTDHHVANLLRLADYLDTLPKNYRHFSMSTYFMDRRGQEPGPLMASRRKYTACGTVACALGHAPAAGIAAIEADLSWGTYSRRVFGLGQVDGAWDWLFSAMWGGSDDTASGAAARIRYLLANGVPDEWWNPRVYASAMSAEGQDPQGLGAQPASAAPKGDAQ